MKKQNYDEIEYFSKGISLGKNCFPERTRYCSFRKELCRLTVRDKNDPLKSIADVMKSIDRVVVTRSNGINDMDSDNLQYAMLLTELSDQQEVVASDGKLKKFIEENIRIIDGAKQLGKIDESTIQLFSLIEMAYKANVPRQIRLQSINKQEPQWVMSRFEKFTVEPAIVIDKLTTHKLSEIWDDDPRLNKAINEYCEKLQLEGVTVVMTEKNTGSTIMDNPPYAINYYAHFVD